MSKQITKNLAKEILENKPLGVKFGIRYPERVMDLMDKNQQLMLNMWQVHYLLQRMNQK